MFIMHRRSAHPETWRDLVIKRAHFLSRRRCAGNRTLYLYSRKSGRGEFIRPRKKMKLTGLILLGTLGGAALTLHGQDATQPSVDLYSGQKQPDITPTAIPSLEPNGPPNVPELSQLDEAFKPKSLGKEADQRRLHIEWRQLKNRLVNDPSIRAAKAFALAARTDLEKRNRLRNYYNLYYDRMSALASSAEMKLALEALKSLYFKSIDQPRVRPSPSTSPASDAARVAALNLRKQAATGPVNAASPQIQGKAETTVAAKRQAATGPVNAASLQAEENVLGTFTMAFNLTHKAETVKAIAPVTVFAPTDDAFQKAPPGTIDSPLNTEKLSKLLDYHIMKGAVASNELTTRKTPTLNGASLDIKVTNGKIMVNDAHVLKAGPKVPGAVIYVIDKVLIPPAPGASPPTAGSSPTPTRTPE
jgi:uncharacterized surface protein with fasciclin (FAS1) repeats